MQVSDESVQEFKKIYREKYGKELSDQEAYEAAQNLANFAELLYDCAKQDHFRKLKLKDHPDGYHLPDGEYYNCRICYSTISGPETWYREYGTTCVICKKAIDERVVPISVITDRDSWYDSHALKDKFGLHSSTVRKMIRTGELRARTIKNDEHDYFQVFLKEENQCLNSSNYPQTSAESAS